MTAEFTVSSVSADEAAEVPAEIPAVSMSVLTSSFGSEVSWEITDNTNVICEGGRNTGTNYASSTFYEVTNCQLGGGDYTLRCIDSYGDGWHGAKVTINGFDYCGDFLSTSGEDVGRLMTAAFTV
jgi:hypothetical protein